MAQRTTTASVTRVNRRFLFLALILAALSAVLIYPLLTRSSDSTGSTGGGVPVVVAKVAIDSGTTITADMLEVQQVPQNAIGAQAFTEIESVVGEVARYPIVLGEQVLVSKVVGAPILGANDVLSNILESGLRGMAIETKVVVGAGGLVLPGDYVDVFWIPSDPREDVPGAQLLAEDIEVLSVDQTLVDLPPTAPGLQPEGEAGTAAETNRVRATEEDPIPEAVTVTLLLTPEQVQNVFCGEMGGDLRLAVRAFGDHSPSGLTPAGCVILGTDSGQ